MLRAGESAEETSEYQLGPAPRFLRWQFCHRGLFADDELDFGNEVDDQLAVRSQRLQKRDAPMGHLGFAFDQDLPHQHLESLSEGRVGYVALSLVKLARGEEPARLDQHLVQLVDNGGFADAGVTRNKHQFGGSLRHHPIERRKQSSNFALSSV